MTLEEILKNIDQTEKLALIDPSEPQYARTRNGIEVAVRQAKERLGKLKEEYAKAVQGNGVAIFLFGSPEKCATFSKLVEDLGEAVVIDASEMYSTKFLPVLEGSIGPTRQWNSNQVSIMHRLLAEVSKDLNVFLTRSLKLPAQAELPNKEATLNFIRDTIRNQLGDDFNVEYLKKVVAREGLKIRYMGSVAPVIVLNSTPEESVGLGQIFGKGKANVTITDEDEVNKEFIEKTFKTVQKQIKKIKGN